MSRYCLRVAVASSHASRRVLSAIYLSNLNQPYFGENLQKRPQRTSRREAPRQMLDSLLAVTKVQVTESKRHDSRFRGITQDRISFICLTWLTFILSIQADYRSGKLLCLPTKKLLWPAPCRHRVETAGTLGWQVPLCHRLITG